MEPKVLAGAAALMFSAAVVSGDVLVYTGEGGSSGPDYTYFQAATSKTVVKEAVLPEDLSGYECVILVSNSTGFNTNTLDTLAAYVNAGGRIIAQADHNGTPYGVGVINAMNTLATALGSDLSVVGDAIDPGSFSTTTNIDPSPFTAGVGSITYTGVSEILVAEGSDAHSLVRTKGVDGKTFIAVDKVGDGMFALMGDMNVLSDWSNGYTAADNGILAVNLCDRADFDTGEGVEVAIDIKFCSDPNAFNCKKNGVLPVTIFGTSAFDVADIDPGTLQLCTNDFSACTNAPRDYSIADRGDPASDLGASQCAMLEVGDGVYEQQDYLNRDGYDDLDAAFEADEVQAMLATFCGSGKNAVSETLVVRGTTYDGTSFVSVPVGNAGIDQLVKKH